MEQLERKQLRKHDTDMPTYVHVYSKDFNPDYSRTPDQLAEAEGEIASMEGVANLEDIESELTIRGQIARGEVDTVIITTGSCEREISMSDDPDDSTEEVVRAILNQEAIVATILPDARHESRDPNQHYKPRSEEHEKNPDGTYKLDDEGKKIPSFYGSGINGCGLHERRPDPSRMVAGWLMARDLQEHYTAKTGKRLISAHEALLLPLEQNAVRIIEGKRCLVSAVAPWVGDRTREADSPQVEIMGSVINPAQVKIGPSTTAADIKRLYATLNPDKVDGKVAFIFRLGEENLHVLDELLKAVKNDTPNSLIFCDPMHGNTVTAPNGHKTRHIPTLKIEIAAMHQACERAGLRLHGLHLEASGRDDREECVDIEGESPRDKSRVDPELNNRQLADITKFYAELLT